MTVTDKWAGYYSRLDKKVHICMLITERMFLIIDKNVGLFLYIKSQSDLVLYIHTSDVHLCFNKKKLDLDGSETSVLGYCRNVEFVVQWSRLWLEELLVLFDKVE